jgi:glycosyltransferase involved in cell wall biosynthesis
MKILIALSYAPYPVKRGTDRLVMNLVEGLSKRHEVALVTMTLEREEEEILRRIERDNITVRSILAPNRRSPLHRLYYKSRNKILSHLKNIPEQTLYAAPPAYIRLVEEVSRREGSELVLAFYWHLHGLPSALPGVPVAIATQDVDFLVHPRRLERIKGRMARAFAAAESKKRERVERLAYEKASMILTVTDRDRDTLRQLYGHDTTIETLPLAMDLESYRPGAGEREENLVLSIGAYDADFNRDALEYFLAEIFPRCRERNGRIRLEVVGQGVDDELRSLAGPGVEFLGRVEDIRPHISRCSIMVLPLRYGGGVRIRMMEAAAMGAPVVSTPVGVAGMGLVKERDYVEASSSEEMVERIVDLLGNPQRAREIGRNARAWAEETLSMDDYPERLDRLFDLLAARP